MMNQTQSTSTATVRETVTRWTARLTSCDQRSRQLVVALLVAVTAFALAKPGVFLTGRNITSMSLQISDLGVLALAMMIAMVIGGIDLSVIAVANLSSIAAAKVMVGIVGVDTGLVTVIGVLTALTVGVLCGTINGLLIGYLGVPAILATLATMTFFGGLATAWSSGVTVYGFPPVLTNLMGQSILGIPLPVVIFGLAVALVAVLLHFTTQGQRMYLLGANPTASLFSGVRNGRVTLNTHVIASVLAAVAGLIAMGRTNAASPSYGSTYVLVAILIVVLGGVAVDGGSGTVTGVVLAVVTLQVLSTGFNMVLAGHGDSNFFRSFAWGLLLIVVVMLKRTKPRRRRKVEASS